MQNQYILQLNYLMNKSTNSPHDVWKRLSFENKDKKITNKTLLHCISLKPVQQNGDEQHMYFNQDFVKQQPIQTFQQQPQYLELDEKGNESPPSFAKQKRRHHQQFSTERALFSSLLNQHETAKRENGSSPAKKLSISTIKSKLNSLKPVLSEFRKNILKINEDLESHKKRFEENNKQISVNLHTLVQVLKKSNFDEANEKNTEERERLESIIKIKEERIAFLKQNLDELNNENQQLNQKLFDMNQKVAQSELQVQEKVKEIMETRHHKQNRNVNIEIPMLEGEVFDISHIKHMSKEQTSRQLVEEESKIYLQIQEEQLLEQKNKYQEGYHAQNKNDLQHQLFQHLKMRQKQIERDGQRPNIYKPFTMPMKNPSTPTNKSVTYGASLTRIKSHESRLNNLNHHHNSSSNQYQNYRNGVDLLSRVRSSMLESVGSPKGNKTVPQQGIDVTGKSSWKQERSKFTSKYANINSSLNKLNQMDDSGGVGSGEKLSKLGSRIEQLRNEIKKQIHAFK